MSRYAHFAHLQNPPLVKAGQYVNRGQLLGHVGNTGNSKGAHLHFEVKRSKPPTWTYYVNGKTKANVLLEYLDPTPFIKDGFPADFTYTGSRFLQWDGTVFHPGIDINSPNDEGKPVYSPFNGRVQFAEGVSAWNKVARKILPSFFNSGWGNHVWIEINEADPGTK